MLEYRVHTLIISVSVGMIFSVGDFPTTAAQQGFVHPSPPPTASNFRQPPPRGQGQWLGPRIRRFPVQCWHAEPSTPNKPVGGTNETQNVSVFIPFEQHEVMQTDRTFRQTEIGNFSAGGASAAMKPEDVPAGMFASFVGHPVFQITKIEYPIEGQDPPILGRPGIGARITATFLHGPTMGECHFHAAVWLAGK